MNSKTMAENSLTQTRGDKETLTAWMKVLRLELRPAALKALQDKVLTEISRVRSQPSYVQSLAQDQKALDDAASDTAPISVLESLVLGKMDVEML